MNNPVERVSGSHRELPIRELNSSTELPLSPQPPKMMDDQINATAKRAIEEWRGSREQGQKWKEQHLIWLRRQEGPKLAWIATEYEQLEDEVANEERVEAENIIWQFPTREETSELEDHLRDSWDEDSCLALDYAIDTQNQSVQNGNRQRNGDELDEGNLSHIELDVEGVDATGRRIRVQRTLEVKVKTSEVDWEGAKGQKTKMQIERVLILKKPHPFALPLQGTRFKEVHQLILDQLAQHELDKAMEERTHCLHEAFEHDVDHFRKERKGSFGAHDWRFHTPVVQIRGPDGVVLRLAEIRTDAEVDGEVIVTNRSTLIEIVPAGKQSHLFDLPTEGTETERRIRQARWSTSSAIDRCNASGSAERFVMDRWTEGSF